MSQHTPGPWTVEVWDYSYANPPRKELNVRDGSMLLATVAWDEGKENPYTVQTDTANANARLIAAAPQLLAFVETVDVRLASPELTPELVASMRALAGALLAQVKGAAK